MKSIVTPHFPHVVFDGNNKLLYNPVLKKRFANRPEERVRLRWVEYILSQTDHLKSRIGFELPVDLPQETNSLRADLTLFSREMKPAILIECKAPSIRLNESAAAQAARYNTVVGAPYICLTNGVFDFWFKADGDIPNTTESPLRENIQRADLSQQRDIAWWASRGFISDSSETALNKRLVQILNHVISFSEELDIRYLDFKDSPLRFGLNHYFTLIRIDDDQKLAVSILGRPGEDPVLAAVLNRSGKNQGLLIINLAECSRKEPESGKLLSAGNERSYPAHHNLPIFTERFNANVIENLPGFLMRFFD